MSASLVGRFDGAGRNEGSPPDSSQCSSSVEVDSWTTEAELWTTGAEGAWLCVGEDDACMFSTGDNVGNDELGPGFSEGDEGNSAAGDDVDGEGSWAAGVCDP